MPNRCQLIFVICVRLRRKHSELLALKGDYQRLWERQERTASLQASLNKLQAEAKAAKHGSDSKGTVCLGSFVRCVLRFAILRSDCSRFGSRSSRSVLRFAFSAVLLR